MENKLLQLKEAELCAGIAKFLFNLVEHWEEVRNDG